MLTIIKSVIWLRIKDVKNCVFMIFFPVFLVLLIGSALTNLVGGDNGYEITKSNIYYYSEDDNNETIDFVKNVMMNLKNDEEENLFEFIETNSVEEGKRFVRTKMDVFIVQNNKEIEFYSNDKSLIKSSFIYANVKGILQEKELKEIVFRNYALNNNEFKEVQFESNINEINIAKSKTPNSMDYYGVAEIGLIIFYFILYAMEGNRIDTKSKIKDRIIGSGISNFKYYLSQFIGMNIYSYGSLLITYSICRLLLGINYGPILLLPLSIIPFLIIINGIGTILGITSINMESISSIVQTVLIPLLTMLGGGYVAISYMDNNSIFSKIGYISPLTWFNKSIFKAIYLDDFGMLKMWLLIGLIALMIVVLILYYLGRRSDANYEKYSNFN